MYNIFASPLKEFFLHVLIDIPISAWYSCFKGAEAWPCMLFCLLTHVKSKTI